MLPSLVVAPGTVVRHNSCSQLHLLQLRDLVRHNTFSTGKWHQTVCTIFPLIHPH
jgi:hypothetical protein